MTHSMRKIPFLLLIALSLCAFQCEDETPSTDCIDPNLINTEAACILIYQPVCGCDQKTYSNSCQATNSGVKSWTEGECT